MFRKIFIALAELLPAMAFAQKFGTVDMEAIFEQMPEKASAEEQFANVSKTYKPNSPISTSNMRKRSKHIRNLMKTAP